MTAPIKCWLKTADEEGVVVLDPSLARYLEFGSFAHGSGMEWPQESEDEDEDDWLDDEDDEEEEAEPVFLSIVFHDDGTLTADGDEVVEHRGVPDWAWHAGMPD